MKISSYVVAAVLLVAGSAPAQQPLVIKFSHVVAENTPKGKAALKFKELAEKATAGKVKVEVYPNSQLYKDQEEMEALQIGAVQMLAPSVSKFGPLGAKEFEVFDVPYLFDTEVELHKVTQGSVGQSLLKKLEPRGILGLAFWDNGFKGMSANRPLKTVADFKGLKMRIQSSKVLEQQMRDLGAIPQVMAFSEVYQALQTGVVNGTENPPSNLYTQKMYEVQKNVTVSDHGVIEYAVVVNKKFWEGLPKDLRAALEGAMKEATSYANAIAKQENIDALELVRKSGKTEIYVLTPDEKRAWKKALIGVQREQGARIGKETLDAIYKATGFDPNKL